MADQWEVVSVAPAAPQQWDVASVEPIPFSTMKMLANAPGSFKKNVIDGLVEAISNPVQTAQSMVDVARGGFYNAMPEPVQRGLTAVAPYNPFGRPEDLQRSQAVANVVGQELVKPYSSTQGFKQTVEEDPFRILSDVSMLAGGAGAGLKAANIGAKTAQAGNVLSAASNVLNPVTQAIAATKAVGKGAEAIGKGYLAAKSGVGMEPINQAIKAGAEGNQTFLENMRDKVPSLQVLDDAKANLAQMNADKMKEYRSGMVNIKNDKTVLDFTGIDNALKNAESMAYYKGKVKDQTAVNVLEDIRKKVADWKNSDPAEYHTPEGMDALKQTLYESFGKLAKEEKTAYATGKQVYDSVKSEIGKQAPTYAEVMKNYSESSDLINEIERTLSLGNKASADTAMRKLQSLMRNNVNTNYGQRLNLAQELSAAGGKDLMPALAGQAMSSELPRGLQGATNVPTSMLAYSTLGPVAAIGDVLSSSPRLVGETAYKYGQLAGALNKGKEAISSRVPMTAQQAKMAALLANQAGNVGLDQLGDWLRFNQDAATQQQQR
jgi:hypothetical protein